jgi:hypothetical protein
MMKPVVTPKLLQEAVEYIPETGMFFWKERSDRYFSNSGSAYLWNYENSGREVAQKRNPLNYRVIRLFGKSILAHVAALAIVNGKWPEQDVDHINGQKSDNRLCNLREVPRFVNQRNRVMAENNTSGCTGVYKTKNGKFAAKIIKIHLGTFETFEDAVKARQEAQYKTPSFTKRHGLPFIKNYGYSHLKIPRLERREREKAQRKAMKANGCRIYKEPIGPIYSAP